MAAVLAIIAAFVLGFILRRMKMRALFAWALSSLVVPAFVLFTAFFANSPVLGATLWPIELVVGGCWGALAAAIGVFLAGRLARSDDVA